jgi:hypothetical protein
MERVNKECGEPFAQARLLYVFQRDRRRSLSDKHLHCPRRHADFLGKRGNVLRKGVKRFCGSSWEKRRIKSRGQGVVYFYPLWLRIDCPIYRFSRAAHVSRLTGIRAD